MGESWLKEKLSEHDLNPKERKAVLNIERALQHIGCSIEKLPHDFGSEKIQQIIRQCMAACMQQGVSVNNKGRIIEGQPLPKDKA